MWKEIVEEEGIKVDMKHQSHLFLQIAEETPIMSQTLKLFIPYMGSSDPRDLRSTSHIYTLEKVRSPVEIVFTKKDETSSHHKDPLVITLRRGSYDVYRIIVDIRSSMDLLFMFIVKALGVK